MRPNLHSALHKRIPIMLVICGTLLLLTLILSRFSYVFVGIGIVVGLLDAVISADELTGGKILSVFSFPPINRGWHRRRNYLGHAWLFWLVHAIHARSVLHRHDGHFIVSPSNRTFCRCPASSCSVTMPNKSLDATGESVFRIMTRPAMLE